MGSTRRRRPQCREMDADKFGLAPGPLRPEQHCGGGQACSLRRHKRPRYSAQRHLGRPVPRRVYSLINSVHLDPSQLKANVAAPTRCPRRVLHGHSEHGDPRRDRAGRAAIGRYMASRSQWGLPNVARSCTHHVASASVRSHANMDRGHTHGSVWGTWVRVRGAQ